MKGQETKIAEESKLLKFQPELSMVTRELLKERPTGNYYDISQQWLKSKEDKINQKKDELMQASILESYHDFKRNKEPKNYKGPISGYEDRLNHFIVSKNKQPEEKSHIPKINKASQELVRDNMKVEERLLKFGKEYKNKLEDKKYTNMTHQLLAIPSFKPAINEGKYDIKREIQYQYVGEYLYYQGLKSLKEHHEKQKEKQYSFEPAINKKSKDLVKDIYVPLHLRINKKTNVIEEEKDKKAITRGELEEFIKRNYNDQIQREKQRIEMEKEKEQVFLKDLGFKPKINKKTNELVENVRNVNGEKSSVFKGLYANAQSVSSKKEKAVEEQKKKELESEKSLPFKPQINKNYRDISPNYSHVSQRPSSKKMKEDLTYSNIHKDSRRQSQVNDISQVNMMNSGPTENVNVDDSSDGDEPKEINPIHLVVKLNTSANIETPIKIPKETKNVNNTAETRQDTISSPESEQQIDSSPDNYIVKLSQNKGDENNATATFQLQVESSKKNEEIAPPQTDNYFQTYKEANDEEEEEVEYIPTEARKKLEESMRQHRNSNSFIRKTLSLINEDETEIQFDDKGIMIEEEDSDNSDSQSNFKSRNARKEMEEVEEEDVPIIKEIKAEESHFIEFLGTLYS